MGQISGKYRSNSKGKKAIYWKLLQIYTGRTDSLSHQQVCVWQFFWHHHPPAAWRAVKTNRAVYNRSWAARMASKENLHFLIIQSFTQSPKPGRR